jgi:Flp pilus assembly protein TadD
VTAAAITRGVSEHRAGRLDAAERRYRAVLAAEPANAQALHLLGVVLLQRGDAEGARSLLARAAALDPADADCHNRLGLAHAALGARAEAEAAYRRAIARVPRHPEAHNNLGIVLAEAGEADAAVEAYRTALAAKPDFALAHNNLAVALAGLGRLDEAERHYRAALEIDPAYADASVNLAELMLRLNRTDAAAALSNVVERHPDHLAARLLLADALLRAGEPAAAAVHYEAALALDPDHADARGNRALALAALGRLAEAEAEAERAVALAPHAAVQRMNLAMLLLLRGALGRGFREYRWRFRAGLPWLVPRPFPQPRWDGAPLSGLLVWGEQGVGEEVMFASLLPRLAAHARVVVECDLRLVPLFRRSFHLETVARTTPPDPATLDPGLSHQVASGDLAVALALRPKDFASPAAYLVADPARVETLHARYALGPGLKVGIAWRSRGANLAFSAAKSSPLAAWDAILRVPGIRFVNLQYGDVSADLAAVARETGVRVFEDPEVEQERDLDGFAAQLAALDLVITTSNTTAHIAGALGCEVWVLLPHVADWRWQHGREDSLWYPRARLIRQPRPGDWDGVLERAAAALRERLGG